VTPQARIHPGLRPRTCRHPTRSLPSPNPHFGAKLQFSRRQNCTLAPKCEKGSGVGGVGVGGVEEG
jgi:hypothetical protein